MNTTLALADWNLSIPSRWRQVDSSLQLAQFLQNKPGISTVAVDNAPLTINGKTRNDPEWNNAVEFRLQTLVKGLPQDAEGKQEQETQGTDKAKMKKGLMLLYKKNDIEIILESDGLTRIRPFTDPDNTVYYYRHVPAALSAYITRNFDKADFTGHIEEEIRVNGVPHFTHSVASPHPQSDVPMSR